MEGEIYEEQREHGLHGLVVECHEMMKRNGMFRIFLKQVNTSQNIKLLK